MNDAKKIVKAKMVGWYDPGQLARTAVQVLISTIFGRHADRRLFESLSNKHGSAAPPPVPTEIKGAAAQSVSPVDKPYYDASAMTGDEFWFDYIADVGDGFNSTYTMAYHVSESTLQLDGEETKRGEILIFGGDEVYPIASAENYKNNLIGPYSMAFARPKNKSDEPAAPVVFAVPGNHDWYDSLAGFSFNFMENHFGGERWFAGWRAKQERSYFAVKLPAGWWLFGTDMQLSSSLDTPQMEYFYDLVRNEVKDGERIILCNAEPHWITQEMYRGNPAFDNENIGFFEGNILKRKASVFIAGDRHYYRRHEEITDGESKRHRIVAGGGGAFLHPTHKEAVATVGLKPKYELKASFPAQSTSAWLGWWNLLFPLWNWKFGLLTGALYVLTSWAFLSPIGQYGLSGFTTALGIVLWRPVEQPMAFFWLAAIFGGFVLFTDTVSRAFRWVAGPLHGVAHLAGVFFVSWAVSHNVDATPGHSPADWTWLQLLIGTLLIFIGGGVVGPFIMGIYLFISLNIFGRHHNEAFSAIKIEDYKNFVRFKIERDGDLVIYPIGVKKVMKHWPDDLKPGVRATPTKLTNDNLPFLIEGPIRCVKPLANAPGKEQTTP